MNDRNMIWRDCPACARKHLLAAYALLSGFPEPEEGGCGETPGVDAALVLAARGNILRAEESSGYGGNGALADGCFAAAEAYPAAPGADAGFAGRAREARLSGGMYAGALPPAAYAAAHLAEALRELPDLGRRIFPAAGGDARTVTVRVGGAAGLLDAIESAARWVEDTFELTGRETAAAVGSEERERNPVNDDCNTCRHSGLSAAKEPCHACLRTAAFSAPFSKWEPKEEKE